MMHESRITFFTFFTLVVEYSFAENISEIYVPEFTHLQESLNGFNTTINLSEQRIDNITEKQMQKWNAYTGVLKDRIVNLTKLENHLSTGLIF